MASTALKQNRRYLFGRQIHYAFTHCHEDSKIGF